MMNITRKLIELFVAVSMITVATLSSAEVVVVVSSEASISSASAAELQQLFLGKRHDLNGVEFTPIDQDEGNPSRDVFYEKVVQKTGTHLNTYWSRLIFTGKGAPPKRYFDDSEIVENIMENPESVGYIDASSITDGIKVVYTVK